jgi:hypothetical protein
MNRKEHQCTRFKQTGLLYLMAGQLSVTLDGIPQREGSIQVDAVHLKCVRCGATHWVDRQYVVKQGNYVALKQGDKLGAAK